SSMKPNAWETESRSSGSSNMEPERCARARSCSTGAPMLRRKETTGINQAARMSATGCDREPDPSLCMARDGMRVPYESPERTRKYLGNSPLLVLAQVVCHCSPMADPGGVAPPPRVRGEIRFAPYRLDLDAGLLRSGDRAISLRPKSWAVLRYFAERPGVLVTKEEVLDAVCGRDHSCGGTVRAPEQRPRASDAGPRSRRASGAWAACGAGRAAAARARTGLAHPASLARRAGRTPGSASRSFRHHARAHAAGL